MKAMKAKNAGKEKPWNRIIAFFSERDRREWVNTSKFTALTLAIFLALNYSLGNLFSIAWLEYANAWLSKTLLNLFGYNTTLLSYPVELLSEGVRAEINYLCTGKTEISLLIAATVSSIGISARKRMLGAAGAVLAVLLFNPVRITATMIFLIRKEVSTANLWHSILFRLSLFAVIVGYYFAWFYWATRKTKKKPRKQKPENKNQEKNQKTRTRFPSWV